MYGKIHKLINSTKTSANVTFSNAFDAYFYLLLRERRSVTLENIQEEALEVESNMMEENKLSDKAQYQYGEKN